MDSSLRSSTRGDDGFQVMWEDHGRIFSRDWLLDADGRRRAVLTVRLAAEHPLTGSVDRLAHEFALKEELESAWPCVLWISGGTAAALSWYRRTPHASRSIGCSERQWRLAAS